MPILQHHSLNIDYYGIIATLSKEIGIANLIDDIVGVHHRQKVTTGQAVDAMLLNMLAIFMRPLYLNSEFLNDKPVDRLIDASLTADDFNDDTLGKAMDRLYKHGLEEIFMAISSEVFLNYPQFTSPYLHGDTTTMSVHGEYATKDTETAIEINRGYSRDHRPDLKQFVISMVTSHRLPVFITTLSGNTSDKKHFRQLLREYGRQMQEAFDNKTTFIFDAAFYSAPTIKACGAETKWISRVPETITEAKSLVEGLDENSFIETNIEGYKIHELQQTYAGIPQRWVVVESAKAYARESKTFEKKILKEHEQVEKDLMHLHAQLFESKSCACEAAKKVSKTWKYHQVVGNLNEPGTFDYDVTMKKTTGGRGRPKKEAAMAECYQINLKVDRDEVRIHQGFAAKGRFIVATNELDSNKTAEEILRAYKSQHNVERGFRFLKDPMFFVDSIYIKNQSRIMAMAMIMGLALLLYGLAEMKLRFAFNANQEVFLDRYKKQTMNPTIRRVLQTWSGIHVLYTEVDGQTMQEEVLNLKPENKQVLRLLGPEYQQTYQDKQGEWEQVVKHHVTR